VKHEKLGFPYAPVPKRIVADFLAGEINAHEVAVLLALYDAANARALARREPTPRRRPDVLARSIGWPHTARYFRMMLARLAADGYFEYEQIGSPRNGFVYVFTLRPDEPASTSAKVPQKRASAHPQKEPAETVAGSGNAASASVRPVRKETRNGLQERSAKGRVCSAKGGDETAANGANPSVAPVDARPLVQDVQEEANPSSKGRLEEKRLGASDGEGTTGRTFDDDGFLALLDEGRVARDCARNGDRPQNRAPNLIGGDDEGPAGEEAVEALLVELLDARPVDERESACAEGPPCRYPEHRGSDWQGDGGRLVCGVCHPRVGGSFCAESDGAA
jgi:hypothetical protein